MTIDPEFNDCDKMVDQHARLLCQIYQTIYNQPAISFPDAFQIKNNANPAVEINPATEDTLETLLTQILAKSIFGDPSTDGYNTVRENLQLLAGLIDSNKLKIENDVPAITGFAKESGGNLDKLVAPILTVNSVKTVLNAIAKMDGTQFDLTTLAKESGGNLSTIANNTGAIIPLNLLEHHTQADIISNSITLTNTAKAILIYNNSTANTLTIQINGIPVTLAIAGSVDTNNNPT